MQWRKLTQIYRPERIGGEMSLEGKLVTTKGEKLAGNIAGVFGCNFKRFIGQN